MLIAVFKAPLEIVGRRPRRSVRHKKVESDRRIARRPLRETRRYAFSAFTMGACLSSPPKTEPSNERSSEDEEEDFDLFD